MKIRFTRAAAVWVVVAIVLTVVGWYKTINLLVLAGAWCGDCAGQCPLFEKFAEIAPAIVPRYLDRDAHPAAQDALKINGGNRVPVVVFFSEDGLEVARYGERTLTTYRNLVAQLGGESCGSGLAGGDALAGIEIGRASCRERVW